MQPIETQGLWWLPGAEDEKAFGTLSCDETGELRLTVIGGLTEAPWLYQGQYPIIYGDVTEDRHGRHVTLCDSFVTSQILSNDSLGSRQVFFAHRAYFGAHLAQGEFAFRSADLSFSGLGAWAHDLSGFSKEAHGFSCSWESPPHIAGQIPGGSFLIGAGVTSTGIHRERRLSEHVELSLSFEKPVSSTELDVEIAYPLQNFFTFATDHPNAVTKLRVSRQEDPRESIRIVGPTTFSDESEAEDILPYKMLFSHTDIAGRETEVLQQWLRLSKQYSDVFAVYFANIYRPPSYTDLGFQMMMHVLSLYQGRRAVPQRGISSLQSILGIAGELLPVQALEKLRSVLDLHPVIGAERALVELTREHEAEFAPLAYGRGSSQVSPGFVPFVLNTLRFALNRNPPSGPFASEGADLYWLTQRLNFLFKIAMLKEMGLQSEQVRTIVERNPQYVHIRDKIRPLTNGKS